MALVLHVCQGDLSLIDFFFGGGMGVGGFIQFFIPINSLDLMHYGVMGVTGLITFSTVLTLQANTHVNVLQDLKDVKLWEVCAITFSLC